MMILVSIKRRVPLTAPQHQDRQLILCTGEMDAEEDSLRPFLRVIKLITQTLTANQHPDKLLTQCMVEMGVLLLLLKPDPFQIMLRTLSQTVFQHPDKTLTQCTEEMDVLLLLLRKEDSQTALQPQDKPPIQCMVEMAAVEIPEPLEESDIVTTPKEAEDVLRLSQLAALIQPTARTGAKRKLLLLISFNFSRFLHALLMILGEMAQLQMAAEKTPQQLMTGEHQITLRKEDSQIVRLPQDEPLIPCTAEMAAVEILEPLEELDISTTPREAWFNLDQLATLTPLMDAKPEPQLLPYEASD